MVTAEKVRRYIKNVPEGTVFMPSDIPTYSKEPRATLKALDYYNRSESQMNKYGSISKLSDGIYYKEEYGLLGVLPPRYDAVLHALLFSKGKQVGYIIGHQLFNNKGLSHQVPSTTTIITSKHAPAHIKFAGIHIEVKRTKVKIKEGDILIGELEYILNNLGTIQELEKETLRNTLWGYFDILVSNTRQFKKLYSHLIYKKTKALLGALLEEYQLKTHKKVESIIAIIRKDLSSKSEYRLGNLATIIENPKQWNIRL
jgi:hypothetical protein